MMGREWKQMAWGLLLVIIDIRIVVFDLLPDFIGYLLVSIGASKLMAKDRWRGVVMVTAVILGIMSLIGIFMPSTDGSGISPFGYAYLLGMLDGIGHLVIVYGICSLAAARAREEEDEEWAESANGRRTAFLVISGLTMLYNTFIVNMDHDWRLASFLFILAAIVMEIVIILFLFGTAKRWKPEQ
ncbi:hypothetical protein [Paenibacillus spongiae]|uniref:Uncharacterized protein n=1 Tax=Paenibacillus spongiae TaxID=2909671 RepID=A0ABY5SDU4_9BACL|nr:hypothetical protein [Paenibacillus spongiae]UVI31685.1 hypothetical protein L1F29_07670 [Paenibacillus spongiae]